MWVNKKIWGCRGWIWNLEKIWSSIWFFFPLLASCYQFSPRYRHLTQNLYWNLCRIRDYHLRSPIFIYFNGTRRQSSWVPDLHQPLNFHGLYFLGHHSGQFSRYPLIFFSLFLLIFKEICWMAIFLNFLFFVAICGPGSLHSLVLSSPRVSYLDPSICRRRGSGLLVYVHWVCHAQV